MHFYYYYHYCIYIVLFSTHTYSKALYNAYIASDLSIHSRLMLPHSQTPGSHTSDHPHTVIKDISI